MQDYLTTKELAELLRLKERKVYDLAATGAVPCTKVTGKLLFPRAEIDTWLKTGRQDSRPPNRPAVFLGSHDPLLEWALRQSGCGFASYLDGSRNGLERFIKGEGVATGLHIFEADTQSWNLQTITSKAANLPAVLVRFAKRERGLIIRRGDPIRKLADLQGRRFACRHQGTGAQILFECLRNGIEIEQSEPLGGESDAAMAVARNDADAALGLRAIAAPYGLDFVPLVEESFDLLIDRRAYFEPSFQHLVNFLRSRACHDHARKLGGYDLQSHGEIIWNGP